VDQTIPIEPAAAFSLWDLILKADPVVQAVMLGLALASVVCWAIILEKAITLGQLGREVRRFEAFAAKPAESGVRGLAGSLVLAAESEKREGAAPGEGRTEVRGRLEQAIRTTARAELRRMEGGLNFLATTGSAAPFIGLFGTVWGIMNSFTAIAQSKETSLAVVAPGIAEALFATALGLAAAIPAVIAFNQISSSLAKASARIGVAASALARRVSRDDAAPHGSR
jgi:biopolymer transport protein ExbB/TolQ